jgi:exopolyphosphatase / guanosine-5'-triphosphate,3'-diphosphate pyrophosphatase
VTSEPDARIRIVRVGIVDIGSNTARLLVADVGSDGSIAPAAKRRAYLGLGAEIAATGTLSPETVRRTALIASAYTERARRTGAEMMETIVTAPGRQGEGSERLLAALGSATGTQAHVLSSDDEGRLAYEGAVHADTRPPAEVIGVIDVGGGSSEVVVGTPSLGAAWIRSLDVGSLRLVGMGLADAPPSKRAIREAQAFVREAVAELDAPSPDIVLACGGSAKAAARVSGGQLDLDALDQVIRLCTEMTAGALVRTFHLHPHRGRTLLAGALILRELAAALGRPLELAGGGLREGAALALAWPEALAAA